MLLPCACSATDTCAFFILFIINCEDGWTFGWTVVMNSTYSYKAVYNIYKIDTALSLVFLNTNNFFK